MEALPISTLQLPSAPATAGADAVADPGALPAGPEGDFHALLSRNLAGHASRAMRPASALAMLAAEDAKAAEVLSPNVPRHAYGTKGHGGASAMLAAEDAKAAVPAELYPSLAEHACGTKGQVGSSTLPAAEDGKTAVPAVPSPNLAGPASGAKGPSAAEDGEATDEAAQDEPAKDFRTASEGAIALLAALPQPMARPESRVASPASAGSNLEGIGGERAPGAGPRTADPGVPGAKFARAAQTEPGPALRPDPDKTAERPVHGAVALPDAAPAPAPHGAHAALPAGHAPAAPHGADPAAAGPAAPRIETPLGAPGWSTALADRIVMFVGDKQQVAELHINPPHLGPVEITLTVSDDRASAVFASPHAVVRETIESSLPRLREVLAESGINLGQASVTADSPRDGSAQAQSRSSFGGGGGGRAGADNTPLGASALAAARHARGLVDLFA